MASYHCCVPQCANDSRYNKSISFHNFPADYSRKKTWLVKIRRDDGPFFKVKPHTKICSEHFKPEDFVRTLTGMKCLRKVAIPSIFNWISDTPARKQPTPRMNQSKRRKLDLSADNETSETACEELVSTPQPEFHDYMGLDHQLSAEEKLVKATEHIDHLEQLVDQLRISRFGLHRFVTDPKMLLFYTGFSSYNLVMNVYLLLRPSAEKMTRWSQIQRKRMGLSAEINTERLSDQSLFP